MTLLCCRHGVTTGQTAREEIKSDGMFWVQQPLYLWQYNGTSFSLNDRRYAHKVKMSAADRGYVAVKILRKEDNACLENTARKMSYKVS